MSRTMAVPYNIQSHAAALAEGLQRGDKIHVRVSRGHVAKATFFRYLDLARGIVVEVCGQGVDLLWGDIVELWLLEKKPDIYHSDVPEVAEKLKQLKSVVQRTVEANESSMVLYLLDQIADVKKAEPFFREARAIVARIRF